LVELGFEVFSKDIKMFFANFLLEKTIPFLVMAIDNY